MNIDDFTIQLINEAKAFFDKAKNTESGSAKTAFLHASLLLIMSALEACVNSICSELLVEPYYNSYELVERSILLEKEIEFKNGHYDLGEKLKIYRTTERIEYLIYKFSGHEIDKSETWYSQLKQSIDYRNKLVHPKESINISEKQVENGILAVLETINHLYLAIYHKKMPIYDLGIETNHEIL